MADYTCISRTNYFAVTDEEKLHEIAKLVGADVFKSASGKFTLGAYGSISYYMDEEKQDNVYIYPMIQEILPEKEAAIFFEVGHGGLPYHERLRYLMGSATIVTKDAIKLINLETKACRLANEMLGIEVFV